MLRGHLANCSRSVLACCLAARTYGLLPPICLGLPLATILNASRFSGADVLLAGGPGFEARSR
jgi:hypothetical protein